jgi:WD40 repeat protein
MLPSQQPHPSPPSVLAISNNGSVLLSASPTPPTIYIQDLRWGGSAPMSYCPRDARAPVTCATFHASDGSRQHPYTSFLLGFQDGRMELYRLFLPTSSGHNKYRHMHHAQSLQLRPVRVDTIKSLHKAATGGITAAEFLPGYESRIVSIGNDGRCQLVDFKNGGKVLTT